MTDGSDRRRPSTTTTQTQTQTTPHAQSHAQSHPQSHPQSHAKPQAKTPSKERAGLQNETPRELAIRLLTEHRAEIANGIYKLSAKLHPAWGAVEPRAFTHNASTLIGAVAEYLIRGNDDIILKLARDMMKVRKLAGFSAVDFNVLMHVYLPVMRKALLARAPTIRQGSAAFDVVEAVVLPLVTRLVEASAKVDAITTPDAQPAFHGRPFEEISVSDQLPEFMLPKYSDEGSAHQSYDDDDDGERTDPSRRR